MAPKPQTLEQALAHIAAGKPNEKDFAALKGRLDEILITAAGGSTSSLAEVGIRKLEGDRFVFYTVDFPEFFGAVHPKGLDSERWREHAQQMAAFIAYVFTQANSGNKNYSDCDWVEIPMGGAGILPIGDETTSFKYGARAK